MEPDYKNRKIGLVIFGVIQILIGGMCLLSVPMMIFAMIAGAASGAAEAQMSPQAMIPGLLFYLFAAIWFIWTGIGSVMTRKWAYALILVASWLALIGGVVGTIFWIFISPSIYSQAALGDQIPPEALMVIRVITTVIVSVIYVIGPGSFVLFYRSRHVRATCEALDQKHRWTDNCPLPVLAVALMFGLWSVSMLSMAGYNFAMPFFGSIVSGAPGAVICLALVGAGLWTAWGSYKLNMSGWWTAVVLTAAFVISTAMTFSRVGLMEYYEAMDFPEQQMMILEHMDLPGWITFAPMIAGGIILIAYLLYVKRFFTQPTNHTSP